MTAESNNSSVLKMQSNVRCILLSAAFDAAAQKLNIGTATALQETA